MQNLRQILYLTMDDVKSVGFTDEDFINFVSDIFVQFGQGKAQPLHQLGVKTSPKNFNVSTGWVQKTNTSGIKWAAGFTKGNNFGLNANAGVIILNDATHGLPKAIMDAFYISVKSTAAAHAVFASFYARNDAEVLSLLGVSHQGTNNIRAIRLMLSKLREIRVYGPNLEDVKRFCQSMEDELNESVVMCETAEEALINADLVLATEALPQTKRAMIFDKWLPRQGVSIIACDSALFEEKTLLRMDKIIVDGLQSVAAKVPIYANQGEVSNGNKFGRENTAENIFVIYNGLGVHEIYIGSKMYDSAKEKGIGLELAPITW